MSAERCARCWRPAIVGFGAPAGVEWLCGDHFDVALIDVARVVAAIEEAIANPGERVVVLPDDEPS